MKSGHGLDNGRIVQVEEGGGSSTRGDGERTVESEIKIQEEVGFVVSATKIKIQEEVFVVFAIKIKIQEEIGMN